jgi:hypothetical protein
MADAKLAPRVLAALQDAQRPELQRDADTQAIRRCIEGNLGLPAAEILARWGDNGQERARCRDRLTVGTLGRYTRHARENDAPPDLTPRQFYPIIAMHNDAVQYSNIHNH